MQGNKNTRLEAKKRQTIPAITARKGGEPLVALTAYAASHAKIMDSMVDIILVGDSLGMVLYGLPSTLPVTLDMMITHGRAVASVRQQALVVVDMPFGTYQESPAQAFRNAARVMAETGCDAVKIEGGAVMAETISYLVNRGVPVMAHIGLLPQSVNQSGGYRAQGVDEKSAEQLRSDILAVAASGAFSVVIEGVVESVSRELTGLVDIPTIGIGASVACDGQVLVIDDILGTFTDFTPRFVKKYANLNESIKDAIASYANDVRTRAFPEPQHCFGTKPQAVKKAGRS
jgi:3-methyl-2-oxobutanoate hydroxymethyltransferase